MDLGQFPGDDRLPVSDDLLRKGKELDDFAGGEVKNQGCLLLAEGLEELSRLFSFGRGEPEEKNPVRREGRPG
jgi:hypothetical protein